MARESIISRKSRETDIKLKLVLDRGESSIVTGIGFLEHMLTLFSKHSGFQINIEAVGDINVDYHHTVEDIGILLGRAFYEAAGDKVGIRRYGSCLLPMDEALVESAIDFGGRPFFVYNVQFDKPKVGEFDTELIEEFFTAFVNNAKINLHINMRYGKNTHHIAEAIFKSVAKSLSISLEIVTDELMSTKGILE